MRFDYGAIRRALAERVETCDALVAVYDTVPDRVTPPAAAVVPSEPFVEYHVAAGAGPARATARMVFDVVVFAGRFEAASSQGFIDDLVAQIPEAIEADQTLDGTAKVATVTEASNYGVVTVADSSFIGARFVVEVYA